MLAITSLCESRFCRARIAALEVNIIIAAGDGDVGFDDENEKKDVVGLSGMIGTLSLAMLIGR